MHSDNDPGSCKDIFSSFKYASFWIHRTSDTDAEKWNGQNVSTSYFNTSGSKICHEKASLLLYEVLMRPGDYPGPHKVDGTDENLQHEKF